MTSISLQSATKVFDAARIDASFDVPSARRLALLGPSGCGKTTVLRMIAGLTELDRGDVVFGSTSVRNTPPEKRGAAMVFQDHALFPFRTVAENVAYGLKLRGVDADQRNQQVSDALALVRLEGFEARWPSELSGGQRQRVALARAIVVEPSVLLLDEPLSSLDPELRADVRDIIDHVQRSRSITTVLVTHDRDDARLLGDEIAVMLQGEIAQIATPDQLFSQPASDDVARFLGLAPSAAPGTASTNAPARPGVTS